MWYAQELETRLSTLRVLDAGGFPVDRGDGYRIRTDPGDPGLGSVVGVFPSRRHRKAFASRAMNDTSARGGPQQTARMGKYHATARPLDQTPNP